MSDAIAYTRLGRTGLNVSRLCLGTMNFGPQTSEAESFGIMDRALELGINFFDTAYKIAEMVSVPLLQDTVLKSQLNEKVS